MSLLRYRFLYLMKGNGMNSIVRPRTSAETNQNETTASGVSWQAVFAGALVIAALALILLSLGTGLGLSAVSPWANHGASGKTVGIAAMIWLVLTQLIAAAMGGYLAGRLRTRWVGFHDDEVFFRDTAHGFLAWATATVVSAALLASAATALLGNLAETGGAAAGAAVTGSATKVAPDIDAYIQDALFRADAPRADAGGASARAEAGRLLAHGLAQGNLSPEDRLQLAKLIVAQTGISQQEADKRVADRFAQLQRARAEAQQAADAARRAAAHLSLWTFLSLLIGAFVASFAATVGGRQRDRAITL